ncbi:ankyrin repeat and LEM domain-containing protein 1 [Ochlerotatus camptorhynchus]|uniref:ankyrin repeat and LEM domain-containing protein 1 n=1 Tax=Ochlerotatus camptorhynchus TaxID=644619 RepID=UPI0031D3E952
MSRAENYLALCLLDAMEDENLGSLRVLLEKHKANPNAIVLEKNVAPVHLVLGADNVRFSEQATSLMLQYGANPNLRSDEEGMTPLHVAANLGRPRLVEMLLKAGADVDMRDRDAKLPVEYAVEEGHFEVVKVMQNFVFEKKFEKKRNELAQREQQNGTVAGGFVKCLGGFLRIDTPTKNSLLCEESKLTPNRVHYNFDATSPYYINITHRRKEGDKRTKNNINRAIVHMQEEDLEGTRLSDDTEIIMARKNLFELTERNLASFSQNISTTGDRTRTSFIECWRDKIAALRTRNKLSTNIEDIEKILSGFSNSSLEDDIDRRTYTVESNESDFASDSEPTNAAFQTAFEQPAKHEDSLRTNEFALALCPSPELVQSDRSPFPEAHNRVIQITEEYIHTDDEAGLVFYEKKFLSAPVAKNTGQQNTSLSSQSTALTLPPLDYDTDALRAELTNFGEPPGPITKHTKKLYLKKLIKYKRDPERALAQVKSKLQPNFSVELLATLRSEDVFGKIPQHQELETEMSSEFTTTNDKTWREGHLKKSFIYLLIDPRMSENLPAQQNLSSQHDLWKRFLQSIFYVGKGKSSRPYCHLYDAMKLYQQKSNETNGLKPPDQVVQLQVEEEQIIFQSDERIERVCRTTKILNRKQMNDSAKLNKIIDIWRAQRGVICLHVFHNVMPAEAYTREAAIIDALGVQNLTNLKRGDYYGKSLSWPMKRRKQLGILLLYKALLIYLAEGETQLLPSDLI